VPRNFGDILAHLVVPVVLVTGNAADLRLAPQPVVDRLHGADDLRIVRRKHAEVPESVDAGVDGLVARRGPVGPNVDPAQEAVRLRVEEEASRPLLDALRDPAI